MSLVCEKSSEWSCVLKAILPEYRSLFWRSESGRAGIGFVFRFLAAADDTYLMHGDDPWGFHIWLLREKNLQFCIISPYKIWPKSQRVKNTKNLTDVVYGGPNRPSPSPAWCESQQSIDRSIGVRGRIRSQSSLGQSVTLVDTTSNQNIDQKCWMT